MPFQYSCFVSYRHLEASVQARVFMESLRRTLRGELAMTVDEDIYIADEHLEGGKLIDAKLAMALCRSICMLVVYTPTYFSHQHLYCAREFRAMEQLEGERLKKLSLALGREHGLIIPVVLRGRNSLPAYIGKQRDCYNFEDLLLVARRPDRDPQFERTVRRIAADIHTRCQLLSPLNSDLTCGCDSFAFPGEDEVGPWVRTLMAPPPAFPFGSAQ